MHPSIILLLLFSFICGGCGKTSRKAPGAILIGIENLSGMNFSCSPFEEIQESGFRVLCEEGVRFTHAYTPSPLAQAAMGSVLTGLPPRRHGLRDNGKTFLPARTITVPERLLAQGIKTLMVTSSPTIKRYSRLHQGFQIFDDDYLNNLNTLYRPLKNSSEILLEWIQRDVEKDPFLGVIHVSDLHFSHISTQSASLEQRPKGLDSQVEEVDEKLFLLFQALKEKNLWDEIHVIVFGLNGSTGLNRTSETQGTNLFGENVQIPLFVKPIKGREEIPHQWKVDSHVVLQDVGMTLYEIFGVKTTETSNGDFDSGRSLLTLINGTSNSKSSNRNLLIESGWGPWSSLASYRYSIRDSNWLFFFDRYPSAYNTLVDRNEVNRIPPQGESFTELIKEKAQLVPDSDPIKFEKLPNSLLDTFHFSQFLLDLDERFTPSNLLELQGLFDLSEIDETMKWLLVGALSKRKNWRQIQNFNEIWKDPRVSFILDLTKTELVDPRLEALNEIQCPIVIKQMLFFKKNNQPRKADRECHETDYRIIGEFLSTEDREAVESMTDKVAQILKFKFLQLDLINLDLAKGGIILGARSDKLRDLTLLRSILHLPHFQKRYKLLEDHLRNSKTN